MLRLSFIIIIIIILVVQSCISIDQQFEACEPKSCGKGPNISFPFWIRNEHESYCGLPDFEITCTDEGDQILSIFKDDYIVRDIFYVNQSFLVGSNDGLDGSSSCPIPLVNLSNIHPPFKFGPDHVDIYFFYNCTSFNSNDYPVYPIPCASSNTKTGPTSFFVYVYQGGFQDVNATKDNCESMVSRPIDMHEEMMSYDTIGKMSHLDILREGFVLEWNAPNCTECHTGGGRCGFQSNDFICFCSDKPHPNICSSNTGSTKGTRNKVGIGAGLGGIFLTSVVVVLFLIHLRRRKKKHSKSSALISRSISPDSSLKSDLEEGSTYFPTPIFTYQELEQATNNFDSAKELGDGGFGTVYLGKLKDGRVVAVKRLYESNGKRVEQFVNELTILSRLRHQNLVSLYGGTSRHSRELLLVYEYVPNGTVADHLHGDRSSDGVLTWPIRMSIAQESADALAYLHASDIIHRDVKTNNILLDNNFHVKVADFGLSRLFPTDKTHVSTAPQGTPGYVDPEYYQCYQLNDKSDVYSFGVVLIELISSKPAVDIGRHRHEINLSKMAINKIHNHALHELVDPTLGFESDYNVRRMVTMVAELAFRCLQQEKDMRPTMIEVLEALKQIESEEEDARHLKNIIHRPLSPNSVTDKWVSTSTTPNTSS